MAACDSYECDGTYRIEKNGQGKDVFYCEAPQCKAIGLSKADAFQFNQHRTKDHGWACIILRNGCRPKNGNPRRRTENQRQADRDRHALNADYIYKKRRRNCHDYAVKQEVKKENASGAALLSPDAWIRVKEKIASFDRQKDEIMAKIREDIKVKIIQRQDWERLKREYGEDPPENFQDAMHEEIPAGTSRVSNKAGCSKPGRGTNSKQKSKRDLKDVNKQKKAAGSSKPGRGTNSKQKSNTKDVNKQEKKAGSSKPGKGTNSKQKSKRDTKDVNKPKKKSSRKGQVSNQEPACLLLSWACHGIRQHRPNMKRNPRQTIQEEMQQESCAGQPNEGIQMNLRNLQVTRVLKYEDSDNVGEVPSVHGFKEQSEEMNGLLLHKARVQDKEGFSQKLQHSSHGDVDPRENKRSFCGREQQEEGRFLRIQYRNLKNSIAEEREEISSAQSDKFDSVLSKVQNLHNLVCRPREQVADAEAFLDITSTLFASVKSTQNSNGVSLSDFVSALVRSYSDKANGSMYLQKNEDKTHILWETLGLEVSTVFSHAAGASTMFGAMDNIPKQRRVVSNRKHVKPIGSTCPEAVTDCGREQKTETDKNMATMFSILRKHKPARLEALVLNRKSFSQTVENIFALSFLVKDGRVEIKLDENKNHIVVPKNAPTASEMASGEASYSQFIFRFDFKDWKLMMESIESGQELMPHRDGLPLHVKSANSSATPMWKISKKRGLEATLTLGVHEANVCDDGEDGDFFQSRAKRSKQLMSHPS